LSEISKLDNKILRSLFKFTRLTHILDELLYFILKAVEFYANGPYIKGRYGLGRIKWTSFKRLILTGQSHLDAAWRWRTRQGILKARATFKKALDHIDDLKYFTFTQTSPCYFYWMKRFFPNIYERIKNAVKNNRLIPIGGCWIECDTNIPNGESIIRQRLYGQRFYLKEFGFISDVEFLQDSFGFNYNLPQIFKKSGVKLFGTGKLFWNKTEKIPIGMAMWEGPDGTRLPMVHVHFGYFLLLNYNRNYPNIYRLGKVGKTLIASYKTPMEEYKSWWSNDLMLENIFGYGLGDGGHGPIELEILVVEFLRMLRPKKFIHNKRGYIYYLYKKYFNRWAIWNDEWYLDCHRGTYTSVSKVKKGNRDCENILEYLEKYITILNILRLFPKNIELVFEKLGYKIREISKNLVADLNKSNLNIKDILEFLWKIVLYNQFHDILPGSSIPEVYIDYEKDLNQIKLFAKILKDICYCSSLKLTFSFFKSLMSRF